MLPFEDLTSRIIGASFRVHNKLGTGHLEHVYRNALAKELRKSGIQSRIEVRLTVTYDAEPVGICVSDLIVEDQVVVETKAQEAILPGHQAQLGAYLRTSGHTAGLVINFGPVRVDVKRGIWSQGKPGKRQTG